MIIVKENLGKYAEITGYIHELEPEQEGKTVLPAILVLPGGGFRFVSPREGEPIAIKFYAEGYNAFVLDYTTVTKNENAVMDDPMEDTVNALKWIRSHGQEFHLDAEKVAMIGFSGGGHLAAAVSTHCQERPSALVLGYPGITHNDLRALDCPDVVESVDENTPPTFMFAVRNDPVTPPRHPLAFAAALEQASVDFEIHIFKGAGHGQALGNEVTSWGDDVCVNDAYAQWFPMCIRWLKDIFSDLPV